MTDDVVVSIEWLADHLDDVRVVDVRDAWEYEGIGHVPGAVSIPFDEFRADAHAAEGDEAGEAAGGDTPDAADEPEASAGEAGMLPGAEQWADLLGSAGIAADDTLVAYDDTHGVFAARFLVTASLYGHRDVHLLDGDYSAWLRSQEVTTEVPGIEETTYEVRADPAEPGPSEPPLVDTAAVADAVDSDAVIVDTREDWEYEEGHVPGAVLLDWRELVDDETRGLKPRDELLSILESRGITPERRVVLYCNTARRISHTYVVLKHLGFADVAFFEGSLTAWLAAGREVESGTD